MKEIYLVRHGETDWNNLGLAQGSRNDIKLNKTGMEQAKYTGKYLNEFQQMDIKFDLVLCSPMLRTVKTAEIICKQINYDFKKVKYMDELVERDQGLIAIGKKNEELKKDKFYNEYFKYADKINKINDPIEQHKYIDLFHNNVLYNTYEYEDEKDFFKKIKIVVNLLKETKAKKILVVTHGGTILHGLISLIFGIADVRGNYKYGKNCHISYITYEKKKFKLAVSPNTLHFGLYGKDYSKF